MVLVGIDNDRLIHTADGTRCGADPARFIVSVGGQSEAMTASDMQNLAYAMLELTGGEEGMPELLEIKMEGKH